VKLSRREFLYSSAAAAAGLSSRKLLAQVTDAANHLIEARIDPASRGAQVPDNFIGLSYESAQLADPSFFSRKNTALVNQFRALGPRGVLRFGGSLAEFTNWWEPAVTPQKPAMTPEMAVGQSRFEWIMVTPSVAKDKYAVLTPASLKELSGFLDETGWTAIYGLNLGCGTPERAAREAACAVQMLGRRLDAFQIGNEVDYFNRWKRPPSWNFDSYWGEYSTFVKAIRARTPSAPFAGPDVANKTDWVEQYADHARHDAVLLTSHYYRMGPPNAPRIDNQRLLAPNPLLPPRIAAVMSASKSVGIPYRATEVNSCSHGGMKGVSDAFASALWVADYMLQVAQAGFAGVNLHGGGIEGVYSPIVGDAEIGFTARPITFGMRFANGFAGATFLDCKADVQGKNVGVYAARKNDEVLVAVINKTDQPVSLATAGVRGKSKRVSVLRGPALDATTGTVLETGKGSRSPYVVAPYSAELHTCSA
jgi:hypothetical protein